MRPTAVDSSFEVAFWFLDRAIEDGEYLQPQKLQRLMYLAQAYFGVLQNGAKLMPATFVARDEGPIEPTIFKALARGRPPIDVKPIDEVPRHVLDSVWRQFGAHSIDYLDKLIRRHPPFADALAAGSGSEILLEAMIEFYGSQGTSRRPSAAAQDAPSASKVLRPKVMRNHSGKPVSTTRWMPKRVD
ncbi:MAG: Panacea domain-containing protein [Rhodospirillaceae bacterium]